MLIQKEIIKKSNGFQYHEKTVNQNPNFCLKFDERQKLWFQYYFYINFSSLSLKNMNKNNVKTIQNYVLEQLKSYSSDECQFWNGKHKILKKCFILKKVGIQGPFTEQIKAKTSGLTKQEWIYQNLMREVNMLKRQNILSMPKCHKIIKTTNSIYLVYDQFPGNPLSDLLSRTSPSRSEKIQLLLQIAKQLKYFHEHSIVFLNISVSNIHANQNQVFFRDWSLSRNASDVDFPGFQHLERQDYIARQIRETGHFSQASDIYSIGKVFEKIIHSGLLETPTCDDRKLQELIAKMIKQNPSDRPNINLIIKTLQTFRTHGWSIGMRKSPIKDNQMKMSPLIGSAKELSSSSKNSTRNSIQQDDKNRILGDCPTLGHRYSLKDAINGSFSAKGSHSAKDLNENNQLKANTSYDAKNYLKSPEQPKIKQTRFRKNSMSQSQTQDLVKNICQKRNSSFFILSLAQFVVRIGKCIDLGYILTKYARLSLKGSIDELSSKIGDKSHEKLDQFLSILNNELSSILTAQALIKDSLDVESADSSLLRELKQQHTISDRFLKSRIVQFAKEMVIICENQMNKKENQELVNQNLFNTLMILKKLEVGSYETFWEKNYEANKLYLSSQSLLKDQLKLGHRYLKNRIAQILCGK